MAIINQGQIVIQQQTEALIRQFSSAIYRLELSELPVERISKLIALGALVEDTTIRIPDPALLYPVLEILKPLPIIRLETERANLTDIFLKLTQSTLTVGSMQGGIYA